jgi:hypothetical protein
MLEDGYFIVAYLRFVALTRLGCLKVKTLFQITTRVAASGSDIIGFPKNFGLLLNLNARNQSLMLMPSPLR